MAAVVAARHGNREHRTIAGYVQYLRRPEAVSERVVCGTTVVVQCSVVQCDCVEKRSFLSCMSVDVVELLEPRTERKRAPVAVQ